MNHFLEIPELIDLVLSRMSQPDQARFLRVSRSSFHSAVPFVWQSLEAVSVLLELISGMSYRPVPDSEGEFVELPEPLGKLNLARFKFYAEFVKKVTLCRATNCIYDLPAKARYPGRLENFLNWLPLLNYANSCVLLPKLVAIYYRDFDHSVAANWFSVLLSSSVRTVQITHPTLESLSTVLGLVASRSSTIMELNVFPKDFTGGEEDFRNFNQLTSTECISEFRELRTLECNLALLHPDILSILGTLPHLRKVTVDVRSAPCLTSGSPLPDDYFPSLQELRLEYMSPSWATSLRFMQPLFKRLQSVSVSVHSEWSDNAMFGEHWADLLLICLSENTPHLSSLTVCTAAGGSCLLPAFLSLEAQQAMSQLPLKTLSLDNVHFGDGTGCTFLSSSWPDIEELRCGIQKCTLAQLFLFACGLSCLRELELDVDMSGSSITHGLTFDRPNSPRHITFCRLSRNTLKVYKRSPDQTIKLAKYLYTLWPNVCVTFDGEEDFGSRGMFNYERDAYQQLRCLNTCITQVRAGGT